MHLPKHVIKNLDKLLKFHQQNRCLDYKLLPPHNIFQILLELIDWRFPISVFQYSIYDVIILRIFFSLEAMLTMYGTVCFKCQVKHVGFQDFCWTCVANLVGRIRSEFGSVQVSRDQNMPRFILHKYYSRHLWPTCENVRSVDVAASLIVKLWKIKNFQKNWTRTRSWALKKTCFLLCQLFLSIFTFIKFIIVRKKA